MTERTNMPFEVKDCAIIARMGGVETAINLRELRERIAICPVECLFHHFCETLIRPSFDDPEFRNDFAIWSARQLRDRILAERLGIINPYKLDDLEQLREHVIEVIDDRLSELAYIPWVPHGNDFRFMRAVTAVFGSGIVLNEPRDLVKQLPQFSHSSVYYHFVEARRRTPEKWDDFSAWLAGFGAGTEPFLEALRSIDFYYLTLPQLKQTLLDTLTKVESEITHDRKVARRV